MKKSRKKVNNSKYGYRTPLNWENDGFVEGLFIYCK